VAGYQITSHFASNIKNLAARITGVTPQVFDLASAIMQDEMKRSAPVIKSAGPHPPGELRDSIHELQRTQNSVTIGTKLFWAKFVEFGTHAHFVRAKRVRLLANRRAAVVWPGAAHPVAKVEISATATPFTRLAKMRAGRKIPEAVRELVRKAL
jgi:hypothetical protein